MVCVVVRKKRNATKRDKREISSGQSEQFYSCNELGWWLGAESPVVRNLYFLSWTSIIYMSQWCYRL